MIMIETALGRLVPRSQMATAQQDLVLKVLYDVWGSPFNPQHLPMVSRDLAEVAGMSESDAEVTARYLVGRNLVEQVTARGKTAFQITQEGVAFVRNASQGLESIL